MVTTFGGSHTLMANTYMYCFFLKNRTWVKNEVDLESALDSSKSVFNDFWKHSSTIYYDR